MHTTADISASPLVFEIQRLQSELDAANESIDDKIDQLEEAGVGVVGLTRQLESARGKIVGLEERIARMSRTDESRARRLKHFKCGGCGNGMPSHLLVKLSNERDE